ncbi:MAG TPA: hypothetical protein VJN96_15425 [Vicinamibacterales bacterium]|nr:hypothetical protein [Vicinamibacterales bacterium]
MALITWLNATPTSFADAAQREALRRQLVPKPTRQLTNLNLPPSAIARIPDADTPGAAPVVATTPVSSAFTTNEDGVPASMQARVDGQQVTPPPAPAPAVSSAPPAAPAAKDSADDGKGDEKFWRNRYAAARQKLDDDQNLAAAIQTRISSLTADFTSRDDPAQRAKIGEDRRKALDQLDRMQKQIAADQKACDQVQEDARRAGVPAGWVR